MAKGKKWGLWQWLFVLLTYAAVVGSMCYMGYCERVRRNGSETPMVCTD